MTSRATCSNHIGPTGSVASALERNVRRTRSSNAFVRPCNVARVRIPKHAANPEMVAKTIDAVSHERAGRIRELYENGQGNAWPGMINESSLMRQLLWTNMQVIDCESR